MDDLATALQFDVFVSYSHHDPDLTWVRHELVPRLRAADLRVCLDSDSFRLGAPIVLEMGRAVEGSRYTLAVLTPDYLESGFTELESVLAEHLGLEQRRQKLLIVMRSLARPRLGFRARLWLDMTRDSEIENQIGRLVETIRASG
jgi:hypothetical protein